MFRTHVSQLVQLVDDTADDHYHAVQSIAKLVRSESKAIDVDLKSYSTWVNEGIARAQSSDTLLTLLSKISPKLSGALIALLITNMITNAVTKLSTLQVALGVSAREKHMINTLYDFSVTCSYDKVLRFKSSAAHHAEQSGNLTGHFICGYSHRWCCTFSHQAM